MPDKAVYEFQYLRLERLSPNKRTERWGVYAKRTGDLLGMISWFGRWRQYCFFPEPETVFNKTCMGQIAEFMWRMNDEHGMKKDLLRVAKHRDMELDEIERLLDSSKKLLELNPDDFSMKMTVKTLENRKRVVSEEDV